MSEEFRKSIAYMEAKDVLRASELLSELNGIISKLEISEKLLNSTQLLIT
ncbi:MAG: hypothetical protein QXK24_08670 [Ignisphaera sp.]